MDADILLALTIDEGAAYARVRARLDGIAAAARSKSPNPKAQTPNPKPYTLNPQPETLNLKL